MNAQIPLWQAFAQTLLFAGLGALLKLLVQSVRHRSWRRAVQLLASAFWGGMATLLISEWLEVTPKTLLVLATLLGWLGFETSLDFLGRLLEKRLGLERKP